jgi:hypothetical protein
MQNAHERFGLLEFTRRVKDTINEVRVQMDRLILEPGNDARAAAHLILWLPKMVYRRNSSLLQIRSAASPLRTRIEIV